MKKVVLLLSIISLFLVSSCKNEPKKEGKEEMKVVKCLELIRSKIGI